MALGHTLEHNLGFRLPYKVHVNNLVMWYTIVIHAIKYYSWQRYPGPTLNQLTPKLPQKRF